MDYISLEKWEELSKWLDISQKFYEAYTRFRIEGTSVHWFSINNRKIEIGFSYADSESNWINVKIYCLDSNIWFCEEFFLDDEAWLNENNITKLIIAEIYGLAWKPFPQKVFRIETDKSVNTYKQIENILIEKSRQSIDAYLERACLLGYDSSECIIELYGRQIYVLSQVNDADESYINYWFTCIDTNRGLQDTVLYGFSIDSVIQKILYLALEPECFKINTSDYYWEYELIKRIVVPAINICPYSCESGKEMEERSVELHSRQIRMQLKYGRTTFIEVFLDCITTGRSKYCLVREYDEDPKELIRDIQELAWENA
ncbi:hypothetical protein [Ruminococcus sp.]|jgi:hypothetical protein|uniref:hypothetical protein n=1 Tax=Ruminococcus sp. TaxID=41978 RepID=UPI0025D943FD|nr:hypothetical protein [Ruminococcus sp.]